MEQSAQQTNIFFNLTTSSNTANQMLTVKPQIYRIIESTYVAFALYIFLSLTFYLVRPYMAAVVTCKNINIIKGIRTPEDSSTTSFEEKPPGGSKVPGARDRYHGYAHVMMTALTVIMSSMVLVHVVVDLWAYSDKNGTSVNAQCVRHWVSGFLYVICAFCLYTFLWIRQRAFYAHPVLKHLAKPCLIRFSWSVLATIIIGVLATSVMFFRPQITQDEPMNLTSPLTSSIDYAANGIVPRECGFERKEVYLATHFTITLAFLYFQIALQFLFAYPIYKQRRSQSKHPPNPSRNKTSRDDAVIKARNSSNLTKGSCASTWNTVPDGAELPALRLSTASGLEFKDLAESNKTASLSLEVFRIEDKDHAEDISLFQRASQYQTGNYLTSTGTPLAENIRRNSAPLHQYSRREPLTSGTSFKSETDQREAHLTKENRLQRSVNLVKKSGANSIRKISSKVATAGLRNSMRHKNNSSTLTLRRQRRARMRLTKYVIRCFCVSIICSVSDVIAFLLSYFAQMHEHHKFDSIRSNVTETMLTSLAYNANVIINLLCMLACYKNWRVRLCPWYFLYKEIRTTDTAK